MTKKIFRSILLTSLAVLCMGLAIAVGCLYYYFENIQTQQLHRALTLAAGAVEEYGAEYLESLEPGDLRLTLILPDGTVRYDTQADAAAMESHAGREEIRQAMAYGAGQSTRYSATRTEKTIYYALRLRDGSVLRISVNQATVLSLLAGIAPWLIFAGMLAAGLSWVLARHLSKRIITPLNQVDLEAPLENDTYEELSPLLSRIHRQHEQIDRQLLLLRQKTDEFDQITSSMTEGLVLLDARGNVLSINPAASALFGAESSAVGKGFLRVERSHEMDCAVADARDNGHASLREARNGRIYQFDISRIESAGNVVGLVILAFDVSEQEFAEQSRREFTANVSHELKTPLTAILASAEMLESNLVKPEDVPRFVGHIHQEAARLLCLIEDIIRLSQLDEGVKMEDGPVDLAEVARDVAAQLQDTAAQHQVKLEVSAQRCILRGEAQLLHEIVYNLTENAIKYNVAGGRVRVNVSETPQGKELTVADTGIGIPPEHQGRVFERFYRVDKSHSKASGGTGLGLSIVKHAAASFHADIRLQSTPGKGTTVTVVFPA